MCLRFLVKYILFAVNLLFTLIGLALVALGVFIYLQLHQLLNELVSGTGLEDLNIGSMYIIPYVVIGLGIVIFLIAFCGCCGSITETKWLLATYAVVMTLLAAAKIYLAVQLLTKSDDLRETVENYVNTTFYSNDTEANATFHALEVLLTCCGTTGPDSYDYVYENVSYVPSSCCLGTTLETINGTSLVCTKDEAIQDGCLAVAGDLVQAFAKTSGHILIYIIIAEAVAVLFAIYVAATIKNKKYA